MSNAIEVRKQPAALVSPDPNLPVGATFDQMMLMAGTIYKSGMFGHKNAEGVFVAMLKGRELGVPATVALSMIHVINGKPTASGELMLSLVERDYGRGSMYIDLAECSDTEAVVRYRDPMSGEYKPYYYTIEMAGQAGLLAGNNRANWERYPGNMLRWRAVSNVAKAVFPASIGGLYTPEEMGANVTIDAEGNARIVDVSVAPADDEDTRERRMRYLHVVAAEVGFDHDDLSDKAAAWYGVESMRDLTTDQIGRMIEQLQILRSVPGRPEPRPEPVPHADSEPIDAESRVLDDDRAETLEGIHDDEDLRATAGLMDEIDGAQTQKELNGIYKRAIDTGRGPSVHRHYERRLAELRNGG
jgi:hypothetical protein